MSKKEKKDKKVKEEEVIEEQITEEEVAEELDKNGKKKGKKGKKGKKKKTPEAIETKQTVWKSVTALICTAAMCLSVNSAVGKYVDAVNAANGGDDLGSEFDIFNDDMFMADATADDTAATGTVATDAGATDTADTADTTGAGTEETSDVAQTGEDTTAAAQTDNGTTAKDTATTKAASTNDPTQYTKAQIVNYYNTALKNTVKQKVTINRAETITIICDEISPNSSALKKIVDKILDSYAKTTTEKHTFTNGKASDTDKTASEFICPSNLEAAGAKSASVVKSGSNYIVTINVAAEKSTLSTEPKYNKQCAAPLDLASVDLFGVTVTQADFTYPGSTLKATINSKGLLVNMQVTQPLSGTGGGKALGISISGTLHGSFDQKCLFTYA